MSIKTFLQSVADVFRRLLVELGLTKDPEPTVTPDPHRTPAPEPEPLAEWEKELLAPRYVLVKDRTADYGIRDRDTGLIADYMTEDPADVIVDIDRLNSGADRLDPLEAPPFESPEGLYPPYETIYA